jgi:D-galacturonate reductase
MDISFASYPADDVSRNPLAYRTALEEMRAGDVVIVFTPDDTHFQISLDAVRRGCHVLVAKPLVKTLDEHQQLSRAADDVGVLVAMEVHKRWDPIYADARDRIRKLGQFSYFSSYMSQPKSQLDTFRAWAGKSSDISYYLNAHHIDFNVWAVGHMARPRIVFASSATGVARGKSIDTEDTITLTVTWESLQDAHRATAVYTSSWIAPASDVHSQQRFFYMGQAGELMVDQAHRGYSLATDERGLASPNPLFMKYTPDCAGNFSGQAAYGYRSIEAFVQAVKEIRSGHADVKTFRGKLATVQDTPLVTAILEAGRRSLDQGGTVQELCYDDAGSIVDIRQRSHNGHA